MGWCRMKGVDRGMKWVGIDLQVIEVERDIGVLISNNLRPSKQCAEAARKANVVLGQIIRSFNYRDRRTVLRLYKQYVRVHLEFSVPAWSPWSVADIECLEKVQKRAVNMVSGLTTGGYEEKLKALGIQSLADRRVRFDMIETFKILKGFSNVDPSIFFQTVGENPEARTRGRSYHLNLIGSNARTEVRKIFFSNRVPTSWNALPEEVKNSNSVSTFKHRYDRYLGTPEPA